MFLMLSGILLTGCARGQRVGTAMSTGSVLAHAERYLRANQPQRAAELFAEANAKAGTAESRRREALAWLAAEKPAAAEKALMANGPTGPAQWQLTMAVLKLRQGDARAADSHIDRYLVEHAFDAGAQALKAQTACRLNSIDEAVAALKEADRLLRDEAPLKKTVVYNLAVLLFRQGAYSEANSTFVRYMRFPGVNVRADRLLAGVMAYAVGDHARAAAFWQSQDEDVKQKLGILLADEADLYADLASN